MLISRTSGPRHREKKHHYEILTAQIRKSPLELLNHDIIPSADFATAMGLKKKRWGGPDKWNGNIWE